MERSYQSALASWLTGWLVGISACRRELRQSDVCFQLEQRHTDGPFVTSILMNQSKLLTRQDTCCGKFERLNCLVLFPADLKSFNGIVVRQKCNFNLFYLFLRVTLMLCRCRSIVRSRETFMAALLPHSYPLPLSLNLIVQMKGKLIGANASLMQFVPPLLPNWGINLRAQ